MRAAMKRKEHKLSIWFQNNKTSLSNQVDRWIDLQSFLEGTKTDIKWSLDAERIPSVADIVAREGQRWFAAYSHDVWPARNDSSRYLSNTDIVSCCRCVCVDVSSWLTTHTHTHTHKTHTHGSQDCQGRLDRRVGLVCFLPLRSDNPFNGVVYLT